MFNTWYGDNSWTIPIWTLSLELQATFMVYLIAQTAVEYKKRGLIYACIMAYFLVPYLMVKNKLTKQVLAETPTSNIIV